MNPGHRSVGVDTGRSRSAATGTIDARNKTKRRGPNRAISLSTVAVCAWSVAEATVEFHASNGRDASFALFVSKLIWIGLGLASLFDVRWSRCLFAFLCCASLFAIAPGLPIEYSQSLLLFSLSFGECLLKTCFLIFFLSHHFNIF